MKRLAGFWMGLLVLGASKLPAQEVTPAPAKQATAGQPAGDKDRRLTAALQRIRDALKDLPAGADTDQIKRALDRIQKRLLEELEGRIAIAAADLEQWQERAAWSARMVARGYLSKSQGQADQNRARAAALTLSRLQEQRRALGPSSKSDPKD